MAITRLSILRIRFCFQRLVTPLMCACKRGEADAVQALLSAGADRLAEVRRLIRLLGIMQASNCLGMVVVCFSSTACLFRSLLRIDRAFRTRCLASRLPPDLMVACVPRILREILRFFLLLLVVMSVVCNCCWSMCPR